MADQSPNPIIPNRLNLIMMDDFQSQFSRAHCIRVLQAVHEPGTKLQAGHGPKNPGPIWGHRRSQLETLHVSKLT